MNDLALKLIKGMAERLSIVNDSETEEIRFKYNGIFNYGGKELNRPEVAIAYADLETFTDEKGNIDEQEIKQLIEEHLYPVMHKRCVA